MPELVPSWRLPSGGRRSAVATLTVLVLVVVGAVIGGWLARSGPGPSPSGSAGATFVLVGPAPGSVFFGTGRVSMLGLVSGTPRRLEVVVLVGGVEVGSVEVEADADGPVSVVVPILPPVDGGPAVLEVRRAGEDVALASVDILLEPAYHLIVWAPQSRSRLEGPSVDVIGFARPPARSVLLELIAPDALRLAIETVDLETSSSSSEVAAPWRRFEASLPLPADAEQACLWLTPSALGPSGHTLFALDMPLTLAGPPGPGCPPSRGMRQ